jgi:hypothetical protein
MDAAKWTPKRKSYSPSWLRGGVGSGDVYGEQRSEYEQYAKAQAGGAPPATGHDGKGFGGGEATRDPAPTHIDPNDPKGKQQAIHKAESFAEYLAKREAL